MNRLTRIAAYAIAAASLAACSSSPMGPAAAKCDARSGTCANSNFVNPNVNFVNPNVNFVNPLVNFVNPNV
ncbi:MAG: hypothetical protein Q8K82_10215 [Gemmatimonadaceae bacterium]|nr:hypothetical protein [Gemmatimonadaceae bacterium]